MHVLGEILESSTGKVFLKIYELIRNSTVGILGIFGFMFDILAF